MVRGEGAEQARAVALALDAGITYFDTAPSYGNGMSEENLGRALAGLESGGRALVGTKVRIAADELSRPATSIRSSLEASLNRLGRDSVELFQLHNPIHESLAALDEICEAMDRTVESGLAEHIGFTGLGNTAAVHGLLEGGPFETVQAYFNVLNPSGVWAGASGGEQDFQGLIARAEEEGIGVINIRAYAAGALAGDVRRHPSAAPVGGSPLAGADYGEDVARADRAAALATEMELESPLELGLRFALAAPGISTVLVGLSSIEHLEAALRWESRGPLAEAAVDRVVELARG
jgi:aryl-alcohol dehydrogenase-like predicted oxidoreductase